MILIPGHGQQDHEDPDGQRRRLDDPQHRQQGERIPLLRAERERCGEDHVLHFILFIFDFPSDQPMLLGKYSGNILFPVDWNVSLYQVVKEIIKFLHAGQIQLVVNKQSG